MDKENIIMQKEEVEEKVKISERIKIFYNKHKKKIFIGGGVVGLFLVSIISRNRGHEDGYEDGYEDGHGEGYKEGHEDGKVEGIEAVMNDSSMLGKGLGKYRDWSK